MDICALRCMGVQHLCDAQVLALVVAAKVKEVALVAGAHDAAAALRRCQRRRRRPRTDHSLLPHWRHLHIRPLLVIRHSLFASIAPAALLLAADAIDKHVDLCLACMP